MRIGTIDAAPGEATFGVFNPVTTHAHFAVGIPLHVVRGAQPGPTLVVQAGVSGLEIEPAMVLPSLIGAIDPATLRGTLVLVPLLNTSGFEFEQERAVWDDADLNAIGLGDSDGTVSQQLIAAYANAVLAQADAIVEIRTGAQWGYFHYAAVYAGGASMASAALAAALGLPQVVTDQPADASMVCALAANGKTATTAWIGGGPGLRDYRDQDMTHVRRAVLHALQHLGMIDGDPAPPPTILRFGAAITTAGARGLTFMDLALRGTTVAEGDQIGFVRHPFTGDVVRGIVAPRAGVVVHAGAAWPMVPDDALLAMIGIPA